MPANRRKVGKSEMASSGKTVPPKENEAVAALPVLEVLEQLALGHSLDAVMSRTGLDESGLRACFEAAASICRDGRDTAAKPPAAPLEIETMSLPEALEALAEYGMKQGRADR
jgi:hypothetical protein